MLELIVAVWNEEAEIDDLLGHVLPYVDRIHVVDDVSTDWTTHILQKWWEAYGGMFDWHQMDEHTGLCELVRIRALEMCDDDSWIIMLDADERFADGVLDKVVDFINSPESANITHIYFSQKEIIDGRLVNEFAKVKVFRKSAAHLPEIIHKEPQFDGESVGFNWIVWHRKSSSKQILRETQYLQTYEKLFQEGKVTKSDVDWFVGMHRYVRPHG